MKTKVIAAVITSLMMGGAWAAPTIYGEIDASLDYLPENNAQGSDKDVWEVSSNSSFIGIKGEEKLNDRFQALYLIEWAFNTDGDGEDWAKRNRYIGLKDQKLGTLKLGAHDTPLKQLSSAVDTFNNYVANKADVTGIFTGENRVSNVVVYESPQIPLADGALKLNALLATGESSGIKSDRGVVKTAGRGLGDAWSASLVYDNPLATVGVAYDKAIPSAFLGRGVLNASKPEITGGSVFAAANTFRAIARVTPLEGLALRALYQTSEVEGVAGNAAGSDKIDDAQGWLLGVEYRLPQAPKWTVKGQYSQNTSSFKNDTSDYEAAQWMAGVDYAWTKQFKAYGYAGYLTLEQGSLEDKQPVVGTGLEFKF